MKISILGAGNVGGTLGTRLGAQGVTTSSLAFPVPAMPGRRNFCEPLDQRPALEPWPKRLRPAM
jgi:hypothetical protein